MPVHGLLLLLQGDETTRAACVAELAQDPGLTLGERVGARLPAALELDDPMGLEPALARLLGHPAVSFVDLVFSDFSDVEAVDHRLLGRDRRAARPYTEEPLP